MSIVKCGECGGSLFVVSDFSCWFFVCSRYGHESQSFSKEVKPDLVKQKNVKWFYRK